MTTRFKTSLISFLSIGCGLVIGLLSLTSCGGGGGGGQSQNNNPTGSKCSSGVYTYAVLNDGVRGDELYKVNGDGACTKLVKDFNTTGGSSMYDNTNQWGLGNNTVIFVANDGIHGDELWRSDANGIALVKDIVPDGDLYLNPYAFADRTSKGGMVNNGLLYFVEQQGSADRLWVTDGKDNGTVMLHSADAITNAIVFNGLVYFSSTSSGVSTIWTTDGTTSGTSEFSADSMDMPAILNNQLYFIRGSSLFSTNGTTAGTVELGNIGTASIYSLLAVNSHLLITANTSNGQDLYASDGTNAPALITNLGPTTSRAVSLYQQNIAGNRIFIGVIDANSIDSLWVSGGTAATTTNLGVINSTGGSNASMFIDVNGTSYFRANDGVNGLELWSTDGSTLKQIDLDPASPAYPQNLISYNGNLYFAAQDSTHGYQLWMYNGTNPVRITDNAFTSLDSLIQYNGSIYFIAADQYGRELWKTDGTAVNTQRITDLNPYGPSLDKYQDIAIYNNRMHFVANDGVHGSELWESDGTAANTVMLGDVNQTNEGSYHQDVFSLSGRDYFFVNDDASLGLWRVESSGATLVKRINGGARVYYLTKLNNTVYFTVDYSDGNDGIWRTDGTTANTTRVLDAASFGRAINTSFGGMTTYNSDIYFLSNSTGLGYVLYKLNLVSGSAESVKVINTNIAQSSYGISVKLNKMFFLADDGVNGREMWVSDGTAGNTQMLFDANPNGGSTPFILIEYNNKLYLKAWNGSSVELWESDGTPANTNAITIDFRPYDAAVLGSMAYFMGEDATTSEAGIYSFDGTTFNLMKTIPYLPYNVAVFNNKIYFASDDPLNTGTNEALWVSDGTDTGTTVVASLTLPTSSIDDNGIDSLTFLGDRLYFTFYDDTHGRELWVSDGSEAGTKLLNDLNPGIGEGIGSNPLSAVVPLN